MDNKQQKADLIEVTNLQLAALTDLLSQSFSKAPDTLENLCHLSETWQPNVKDITQLLKYLDNLKSTAVFGRGDILFRNIESNLDCLLTLVKK